MIIFCYSETHSHLVTYFKDEIAHILSVFYENKIKMCLLELGCNLKNKNYNAAC